MGCDTHDDPAVPTLALSELQLTGSAEAAATAIRPGACTCLLALEEAGANVPEWSL
jgi:hypothetical protein